MFDNVLSFFNKHNSFILTTHSPPDADGLGAEIAIASILKKIGKKVSVINAEPIPELFKFMDSSSLTEIWSDEKHSKLLENSAIMVLDTSEEFLIGSMRKVLKKSKEVFYIDHHEPKQNVTLHGLLDPTATSVAELSIELACAMGIELNAQEAAAVYAGIVYDSGFFAYPKTSLRTFKAALKAVEWGVQPNAIYRQLVENVSCAAILLKKQVLSTLKFYEDKKIAVMTIRKEDFENTGAVFEDAENIINIPIAAREVEISLILKEKSEGEVRCSLRSKGKVNVSKIAQEFGGGGHVTAAGFRCSVSMEEIFEKLLSVLKERLREVK